MSCTTFCPQRQEKSFQHEGVKFGWETIEGMFERKVQRAKAGVPRQVPELGEYLDSKPIDAPSAKLVLRYLQAQQNLFEEGFLTHERITSLQSSILAQMESGYKFFTHWLKSLLDQGAD